MLHACTLFCEPVGFPVRVFKPPRRAPDVAHAARAAMALLALSDDALGVIFEGLRNTLDPRVLVSDSV